MPGRALGSVGNAAREMQLGQSGREGRCRMSYPPSDRFDFEHFWDDHKPATPADAEIIGKASTLRIELYRDSDGELHGDWVLSGSVSRGECQPEDVTAELDFAAAMLEAFRRG